MERLPIAESSRMETKPVSTITLALSFFAVLSVEWIVGLVSPGPSLKATGTARVVQILLMLWIAKSFGGGLVLIGLECSGWFHGFRRGLIWSLAFGAAALVLYFLLLAAGVNALALIRAPKPNKLQDIVLLVVVGGILAPVAEEIFFRGVLYGFLRRWGVAAALIIATLLFVLSHPLDRGVPFTQIAGGLVFALAYEWEGNLLVPIVIHVLGNLAIFAVSILS
jgi:uncharacterized protein